MPETQTPVGEPLDGPLPSEEVSALVDEVATLGREARTSLLEAVASDRTYTDRARAPFAPLDRATEALGRAEKLVLQLYDNAELDSKRKAELAGEIAAAAEQEVQKAWEDADKQATVALGLAWHDAFPTPQRDISTADAKSDVRLGLDHLDAEAVPDAMGAMLQRAASRGDQLLARLLGGDWGASYLRSRGVPDSVHGELRDQALDLLAETSFGPQKAAVELLRTRDTRAGLQHAISLEKNVHYSKLDRLKSPAQTIFAERDRVQGRAARRREALLRQIRAGAAGDTTLTSGGLWS